MRTLDELMDAVERGIALLRRSKDVIEAELYATASHNRILRISYTSRRDMPCNGVHEPKGLVSFGVGLRVLFTSRIKGQSRIGFGYDLGDVSLDAVRRCLDYARATAVHNPHFRGLPEPSGEEPALAPGYHDPAVWNLDGSDLVALGWRALDGAIEVFHTRKDTAGSLVAGGDIKVLSDRMALATTKGIQAADEYSMLKATITCLHEETRARGTGFAHSTHLSNFHPIEAGREAARTVLSCTGGVKLPSGSYPVIFGHQPVTELMGNLIVPSLTLSSVYSSSSPFTGRLGERLTPFPLDIYDDGTLPGRTGTRRFTCEGLPTGRTDLVSKGHLTGFLADSYYSALLSGKLREFPPRNGFRLSEGARNCSSWVGIAPTNLVLESSCEVPAEELLRNIENGIYIGRLWYTYPISGLASGDFTSSVTADSWVIRGGRRDSPLMANSVRLNDNFLTLLERIVAVSREKRAVLDWGSTYEVAAPEILVERVRVEEIGGPVLA